MITPQNLQKIEERLYSELSIIGGGLRRQAAQALAQDGSPDAIRVLANASARSTDKQVLAISFDALRQIKKQQCIDEVCAVWVVTRHKDLANLLVKKGWVASTPADMKVLSALKAGQLEFVTKGKAEIVEPLLKAVRDADNEIASRANQCAIALTNPDAIDYLCVRWSKTRDRFLEQVMLQGKYVARQPVEVRVLSGLKTGKRKMLASDGVEMIAPLLQAYKSNDPKIAIEATELLNELKNQSTIDALCNEWVKTRTKYLTEVLQRSQYVAASPPEVRVLSALKVGRIEAVVDGGAEVVNFLLQACIDIDLDIAMRGRSALRRLKNLKAQDELNRLIIEQDDKLACEVAVACQYMPSDPNQRALFLFLTEQWDKYESLDFEHILLQTGYELGNESLRQRIAQKVRQAGRAEWVSIIAGGDKKKRLREMTHDEWETTLEILHSRQKWEEMWRLAQAAPPIWSARLLQQLRDTDWVPKTECIELVQTGQKCVVDMPDKLKSSWYLQETIEGYSKSVQDLIITSDGKLLVSSCNSTVKICSLPDGNLLQTLTGQTSPSISLDGKLLACQNYNYVVNLRSLPSGKLLTTLGGYRERIHSVAISPDGKLLASGNDNNAVRLWSLPSGQLLQKTLTGHSDYIGGLIISPDCKLLASGSNDCTVKIWSLPDGKLLQTLTGHNDEIKGLVISPDGKLLVSSCLHEARIWSLPEGKLLKAWYANIHDIGGLVISPDCKLLASGSNDRTVKIWSLPDGKLLQTLTGYMQSIDSVIISLDSKLLVSGGLNEVKIWSLPDGKLLKTLTGNCPLALSPDSKLLAISNNDNTVKLWTSNLYRLSVLPIAQTSAEDIKWVQKALQDKAISKSDRDWLEFIIALAHRRQRFNIEVEDAPQRIDAGEFDIEIEG